ncbi:MAG: isochorismatase family protein, partial [Cyclobacteriaceae bacterium]
MKISSCLAIAVIFPVLLSCQSPQQQTDNAEVVDGSNSMEINLRKRVSKTDAENQWELVEFQEKWDPGKTAIIITDMWDKHWCESATQRVNELAPKMDKVVRKARDLGVMIIHSPSGTMDFYEGDPARINAKEAGFHQSSEGIQINDWCYLDPEKESQLPIDDSDGGCDKPCPDGKPCVEATAWSRQTPDIKIEAHDYITDQGQEVFNVLMENGIEHVIVMGVHLNMCVLGRPFAIRQMANMDKNVVLMRDMTDTMYNPEMPPHVSHFEGTELVVQHVEQYWAPTLLSTDFTGNPAF